MTARIVGNLVERNGYLDLQGQTWAFGAGIQIAASADIDCYDNDVLENWNGITLIQQSRGSGAFGPHLVQNVNVHNNRILQTVAGRGWYAGAVQDLGDNAIFTSRNNHFENNDYHGCVNGRGGGFTWNNANLNWAGWQAVGNDDTGVAP